MLARLNLVPDDVLLKSLGATSQFNSSKAGLGLFARNRGGRRMKEVKKRETKSHREVVNDKQNLRKRLAYSSKLNGIVRTMGDHLMDDRGDGFIPEKIWTQYDRLQSDVNLQQVSSKELDVVGGVTPGPGAYEVDGGRRRPGGGFGKSERWGTGKSKGLVDDEAAMRYVALIFCEFFDFWLPIKTPSISSRKQQLTVLLFVLRQGKSVMGGAVLRYKSAKRLFITKFAKFASCLQFLTTFFLIATAATLTHHTQTPWTPVPE